jgi:UDP-N-acetylmuramate--alanine ligase
VRNKTDTQLHFVGVGGIGMSGLAEVFLNQGYHVSGSDLHESEITRRLAQLGVRVIEGHRAENVANADVVVVSSAIRATNPEVLEAKRLGVPVIQRAEMLGELMRGRTGAAIAGSHGKTTTTSMLATVLTHAGLDPTLVIGGKVDSLGGNAKLGQGKYVVAEADESDGSFLHLPATFAVVTNIDNDHLDHFGNVEAIEDAFVNFIGKVPFYGAAAVCGDDPGVRRCMPRFTKPYFTYGLSKDWDFYADNVRGAGLGSVFEVYGKAERGNRHERLGEIKLGVPGRHNVLNALASVVIALQMEVPFAKITEGLAAFNGVRRRFEIKWRGPDAKRLIIDDYGHHPTEIVATLSSVRQFWNSRVITVFQPHRYTRTQLCREGFLSAFGGSDIVLICDIYAGGEDPIEGVDARGLAEEIRGKAGKAQEILYVGGMEQARAEVMKRFSDGDLVICLGAGSITKLADQLVNLALAQAK